MARRIYCPYCKNGVRYWRVKTHIKAKHRATLTVNKEGEDNEN